MNKLPIALIATALTYPSLAFGSAPKAALIAPHAEAIAVDGDIADWGPDAQWHRLRFVDDALGAAPATADAEADVALRYDIANGHLYVAMKVVDDVVLTARQETSLPRGIGQNPDGVLLYIDPGHDARFSETVELSFVERPIAADDALLPPGVVEIARVLSPHGMTAEWKIDLAGLFAHRGLNWPVTNRGDYILGFDAIYFDRDSETDGSILMLSPGPHDGIDNRRLGDLFLLAESRPLARLSGAARWPALQVRPSAPPAYVRLQAIENPEFEVHANTSEDGSFTLIAPVGEYTIHAMDTRVLAGDAERTTVAIPAEGAELSEALVAPTLPVDLARLIPEAMEQFGVRTAGVAWLKDGVLAYEGTAGTQLNGEDASLDTRFRLASITKSVTTMVALDMVRTGDWDLDRPLAHSWMDPDIAEDPRSRLLTTRMVLRHLTGLPNWRQSDPLAFIDEPGAHQHYSGEAFELLRRAIEADTGESLEAIARRRIFAPANMSATSYQWSENDADLFAGEFYASGAAVEHYRGDEINAAANLLTTPRDLIRFAQWTFDWASENPALFAGLAAPNDPARLPLGNEAWARHGLGWLVHDDDRILVLEHSGGQQGIRTQLVLVPERREALVVLTNSSGGWPLVRMIFDASLNQENLLSGTSQHLFSDLDD